MSTPEAQALTNGLISVYAAITTFVQHLRAIVLAPDFEHTYRDRFHEKRRLVAFFEGVYPSKYERVRAVQRQLRAGTARKDTYTLVDTLVRRAVMGSVAIQMKNCRYYDSELFGDPANPRPPAWTTFMQTAAALAAQEEAFLQLTQRHVQAWAPIRFDEHHEEWQQYDYVLDPSKLAHMGSLLVQLKSLT